MPDFAQLIIPDVATIPPGGQRVVTFRPGQPGSIAIRSTPAAVPTTTQSATGLLGKLTLLKPGNVTAATTSAPIGSNVLTLTYAATEADLAVAGDWSCRIDSGILVGASFDTEISYVSSFPLLTASFDLTLLNFVLGEAVETAAVCVHLESSGDQSKQAVISWSIPVANLIGGSVETCFAVADIQKDDTTFRLLGLDSDPTSPIVTIPPSNASSPLSLVAVCIFDTANALLKRVSGLLPGNIDFQSFAITVTVGFDGSIAATCNAQATYRDANLDVSGDVVSQVNSTIASKIQEYGLTPAKIRPILDNFFIQLMRLNASGSTSSAGVPTLVGVQVQQYSVQSNSLVVNYYQDPQITATLP